MELDIDLQIKFCKFKELNENVVDLDDDDYNYYIFLGDYIFDHPEILNLYRNWELENGK